jgi:hypothetical protein
MSFSTAGRWISHWLPGRQAGQPPQAEAGNAMIEFALIAPAFLAILCGIMEFSGIIFVQTLLEGGAREASRFGITGSTPDGSSRQAMILQIINQNSYGIIDDPEVELDTLVYESFGDVGQPEPYEDTNDNGSFDEGEPFDDINGNGGWDADMGQAGLGGPGDVVVYRLRYDWDIMIPIFRPIFGDQIPLEANIAVRNEPFGN